MPKIVLKAVLPRDRKATGWLIVEIDGVVKDDYPVLGMALGVANSMRMETLPRAPM
jgi:hypothetical protein